MTETFLGVPDVTPLVFFGFAAASFCTAFVGVSTGAAGGLVLLGLLGLVFPPAVLIPVHTCVQLGVGATRCLIMWRYVLRDTLLPFSIGAVLGAAVGAQVFITLPVGALQGILGVFMLAVTWMPHLGRAGSFGKRFAALGFGASFLGMFVSATGTIVIPIVAAASPDRRNISATVGALMGMVHVTKLVAFGLLGVAMGAYLPLIAAMIATAALGNWGGRLALDHMKEHNFRLVFRIVLTVLGLRLLWMAAGHLLAA